MKSSCVFVYDSSMVSPLSLVFFGPDPTLSQQRLGNGKKLEVVNVDSFVKFNCEEGIFDLVSSLRETMSLLLEYKICNPGATVWDANTKEGALLRAIVRLLTAEVTGCPMEEDDEDD